MVKNAIYEGCLEIPHIASEKIRPKMLIPFSRAVSGTDFCSWVHFYEDDAVFERIWNNPLKYLSFLKKYQGVISPDFSLYRDMPLVMQQWNVYRSHAVGHWLQRNGIPVITNVRWSDERTYELCCMGTPHCTAIAVGSHGCVKTKDDRKYFIRGLDYVIKTLTPTEIIVYGTAPEDIFGKCKAEGISILQFDSDFMQSRKAVNA